MNKKEKLPEKHDNKLPISEDTLQMNKLLRLLIIRRYAPHGASMTDAQGRQWRINDQYHLLKLP
jgi:trehalose-6-phosphatase